MIDRLTPNQVIAMFESIPAELTIIDANDEVVGWNRHETRLFHRPMSCMGLNFRQCHPAQSLAKIEQIVSEMRAGTRDRSRFWIDLTVGSDKEKHKILIEFFALRDPAGAYLGCMECTQDITEMRSLEGQKRLLE